MAMESVPGPKTAHPATRRPGKTSGGALVAGPVEKGVQGNEYGIGRSIHARRGAWVAGKAGEGGSEVNPARHGICLRVPRAVRAKLQGAFGRELQAGC